MRKSASIRNSPSLTVLGLDRQVLVTCLQPLEVRQQCQQQAGEDDARDHQLAQGRGSGDHLLFEAGADRGQRRGQPLRCLAAGIDGLARVLLQLASARAELRADGIGFAVGQALEPRDGIQDLAVVGPEVLDFLQFGGVAGRRRLELRQRLLEAVHGVAQVLDCLADECA